MTRLDTSALDRSFATGFDQQQFGLFRRLLPPALAAYLLFDRAAAYLHIPGTPIYLAEALLVIGLIAALNRPARLWAHIREDALLCAALGYFLWGVLRAVPNVGAYGITYTVRDSSLWYYSLFAVLVVAATIEHPQWPSELAARLVRFAPWLLVWLPLAVILGASSHVNLRVPSSDVSVLSHKDGNVAVAAFLALMALSLVPGGRMAVTRRRLWGLLGVATVLIAGTQNRGGLVAVVVASAVCLILVRGLGRPAVIAVLCVVAVGLVLSSVLPRGTSHARSVSPSQLVANVESVAGLDRSKSLQGTEQARQRQWSFIVNLESAEGRLAYGWGPGPNLGFGQATGTGDQTLRVPHNSHVDVLARLGLIGVGLWALLWGAWAWRILQARRRLSYLCQLTNRRILEVCLLSALAILVNAYFDPSLEGGQVAVLLWTLFGIGSALSNPRWSGRLTARLGEAGPLSR